MTNEEIADLGGIIYSDNCAAYMYVGRTELAFLNNLEGLFSKELQHTDISWFSLDNKDDVETLLDTISDIELTEYEEDEISADAKLDIMMNPVGSLPPHVDKFLRNALRIHCGYDNAERFAAKKTMILDGVEYELVRVK